MYLVQGVLWEGREKGGGELFLRWHWNTAEASILLPSRTSFLILSEGAGSAARSPVAHLTLQRKLPTPRGSQSQDTPCAIKKTTAKTCKEGVLMPSDCLSGIHQTGSSRVCRNLLQPHSYQKKKKKYYEKMCPFPVNKRTKDFKTVRGAEESTEI